MSEPIKSNRLNNLAEAPTPQNTPATAASSYIQRAADAKPSVSTIAEEDGAGAAGLNLGQNPALINMIQGKLSGLIGAPTDYINSLPKAVKDRINALRSVQSEHTGLQSKFQEELTELEKKYHKLYTPLYEKRAKIVSGTLEPTSEEIQEGKKIAQAAKEMWEEEQGASKLEEIEEEEEDDEEDDEEEEDKDIKGIPNFWATALGNVPEIADLITEKDVEALSYLSDIRMNYISEPGFELVFEFRENPYFKNKALIKTYYYADEPGYSGDIVYDRATGSEIEWTSAEKNLTVKVEKRKQRNKNTKATRTVEKLIPVESFFLFFSPISDADEEDEELTEEIENKMELDFHIGDVIKEKLIPNAVDWFTGEALRYEDYDEEDEEDEEDYEDDEDSDDDDDDDDEPTSNKKAEECKQS